MERIDSDLEYLAQEVEADILPIYQKIDRISRKNHLKVMGAFREAGVCDYHLKDSTGYGYGDTGRDVLEKVFARVFGAGAALVREQIVSGTHAIALCLYGILRPCDEILFLQGEPYDTLAEMLGLRGILPGSLAELGVTYKQVCVFRNGIVDVGEIERALGSRTRLVLIQRSRGYSWSTPPVSIELLKKIIECIKSVNPKTVVLVDNCYGEFVEEGEPAEAGADLVAGSLIKNPGGTLVPTGGYVVGEETYVRLASYRWSAPGIGAEVGPSFNRRLVFQGLFLAPLIVAEALKGAVFAARFFEKLGFEVSPAYDAERSDIVQAIKLGTPEKMVAFCRGIQSFSPVDSHAIPVGSLMPGYDDPVIMAAGTFIQGASLELSADGPMRPPYAVYLQGGPSKEYVRMAVISAAKEVLKL